jgi:hypothetical protein
VNRSVVSGVSFVVVSRGLTWRANHRRVLIVLIAMMQLGGCAVDDRGLLDCRWFANDTVWVVAIKAWGVHVTTNRSDAGVTIGHSVKLYGFPRSATDPDDVGGSGDPLGRPLTRGMRLCEVTDPREWPDLSDLGEPLLIVRRDVGVILRCHAHETGLTIGARTHAALRLPVERDGVLVLAVDPDVPDSTQMYWKGAMP